MAAALVVAAACAQPLSRGKAPAAAVGTEAQSRIDYDARMRAVIRDRAQQDHGEGCGTLALPDAAILPVEVTGGGLPEYAVTFGRALCSADGGATTRFSGTGGPLVQFWIGSGGPPRLLLEQNMFGFSPGDARLVAQQHGSFCPGGAGPNMCQVTYVWNEATRRLEAVEHRLFTGDGDEPPPVEYGGLQLGF